MRVYEIYRPIARKGFPSGTNGKEPTFQSRRRKRLEFNPWDGKISWRRASQPTPVFLPGESHEEEPGGLQSIGLQRRGHNWSNLACMYTPTGLEKTSLEGYEK